MELPNVRYNFEGGKKEIANMVQEIGKAIFTSARQSFESAAKVVVPSVPQMVADITDDLSSGPIERFKDGLKKLDRLVDELGVNLGDYSKELAEFLKLRQEKSIKSEETVNQLRTQNIKAQVNEFGEVVILTKEQIIQQEIELKKLNGEIKDTQKELDTYAKIQKKGGTLTEEQQQKAIAANDRLIENTDKRNKVLENLNKTETEDNQTFREKLDNTIDTYVPDQLRDIGSAFTEGLMAPFTAVKELGLGFMSLLKPLKLLPKLFKGFILGMIGAVASLLPFIAIAAAVVLAIVAVTMGMIKLMEVIEENKESLIAFKDKIVAIPGQIKDFFDEKFDALGVAFNNFVEDVKAIPQKISDFFEGIFVKIQNFFIDMINGAIDMLNEIPTVNIDKLENVALPEKGPVDSPVVGSMGDSSFFENLKGTKSVDTEFGTNPYSLKPMDRVNLGTNSVGVGVNTTNISQNTTLGSFLSSKNDDKSRLNLYADGSP